MSMRLEFALTVAVLGVVAALALEQIAVLQVSADDVRAQSVAANRRAVTAIARARESLPAASAAATPCPLHPSPELRTGVAPGFLFPSCP